MIEHVNEIKKHLKEFYHNGVYYNGENNSWCDRKGLLCKQFIIESILLVYDTITVAYFLAQISLGRK